MSQQFNIKQFERIDKNEKLFQKQIQELYNRLTRLENIVYQDNPFNENSESQKVEGLNKANGETPGEVNPVGQIKELFKLYSLNPNEYINARLIEDLILLFNKPRETDKEKLNTSL